MRCTPFPFPLLSLLLAACGAPDPAPERGYGFGQLASLRDTAGPLGLYAPELADCRVRRTGADLVEHWEYDARGRQRVHRTDYDDGWTEQTYDYGGPCMRFSRTESAHHPPIERVSECDVGGWPMRTSDYGQDQDGAFGFSRAIWFDNRFVDNHLDTRVWEIDGLLAMDESFDWRGNRLAAQHSVGRMNTLLDGQTTWTRDADGRAVERTTSPRGAAPQTTTWERDARGRVLTESQDGAIRWTWLYEAGARWPVGRVGADQVTDPFTFDCP